MRPRCAGAWLACIALAACGTEPVLPVATGAIADRQADGSGLNADASGIVPDVPSPDSMADLARAPACTTAIDCSDGNACTADTCHPTLGCQHVATASQCLDADPCTLDGCDAATGCTHVPNLAACDDGNACTLADQCKAGACVGGSPVACDDANPCTADSCDKGQGCVHEPVSGPCSDGGACSVTGTCQAGVCVGSGSKLFTVAYGGKETVGRGVAVLPDGFAIIGTTNVNNGTLEWDVRLVRTDSHGKQVWAKTYGGPHSEFGTSVVALADGLAFTGSTKPEAKGNPQGWLVRTDGAGTVVWQQTFASTVQETLFSLVALPDGFAAAGRITDTGTLKQDMSLRRTDANGKLLWSGTYGTSTADVAYGLAVTATGFALAGSTGPIGPTDAWLVGTDSNGVKLWQHAFGGAGSDESYGVAALADGLVLAGTQESKSGGKFWLIRTDAAGKLLWDRTYGEYASGQAVAVVPDGFALTGQAMFDNGLDVWLVRTDLMGNPLWHQKYGGKKEDDAAAIAALPDGFVVAGLTVSPAPSFAQQMFLVRTDAWGHADCATAGVCMGKTASACDDGLACTVDLCDAVTGCKHEAMADLTGCAAGKACLAGKCQ